MAGRHLTDLGALSDDEAALKQGRGGMLIGFAVTLLVLLGGVWALLSGGDEARVYGDLGRKVNGLRQGSFDQFWGCALPTANLKDINTNTQLVSQIDNRGVEGGRAYGLYLQAQCVAKLGNITPELDALIVPDDMRADVDAIKQATSDLRGGFSGLISYLDNPELRYDRDVASTHLQAIARAWFEWKQAHAKVNKLIKEKVAAR
jgi:hypothetical protein